MFISEEFKAAVIIGSKEYSLKKNLYFFRLTSNVFLMVKYMIILTFS